MNVDAAAVIAALVKAFKQEIDLDPEVPLIDAGLRLESLRMIRALTEFEKLSRTPFPPEEAFEVFSLSINQLVARINHLRATPPV